MTTELTDFLKLSYGELEEKNLAAKEQRMKRVPMDTIREERLKYLTDETRIKAVTLLFSDLEGRLHMLDYDKKFLLKSWDNMTFDGSSIRGFTASERERSSSGHRLVRVLTGLPPITSALRQRSWCLARSSTRMARPFPPTSGAFSSPTRPTSTRSKT